MQKINAKIVADSVDIRGNRITSYILTYPRMIHAEVMTHRMFSRNAASSRAIPFEKMLKMVEEDPFIPIAWQLDHKGMQGSKYIENDYLVETDWLMARDKAIEMAKSLNTYGVTKQLCNRLLEPFMWYTALVTATEYENFFELRTPKYYYEPENLYFKSKKDWISKWDSCFVDSIHYEWTDLDWLNLSKSGAEIHIQALAEAMWDAKNESTPKELKAGEWHIPFGDRIDYELNNWKFLPNYQELWGKDMSIYGIKIAVARAARLSYMTFDGKINYQKDIELHDMLLKSRHASPYEHVSRCLTEEEYNTLGKMVLDPDKGYIFEKGWVDNFRGFISYRRILNF